MQNACSTGFTHIRLLILLTAVSSIALHSAQPDNSSNPGMISANDPALDTQPLLAFNQWLLQHRQSLTARQAQSPQSLDEGRQAAEARRAVMQQMMRAQPERALNGSLRWRDWAVLPAQIQSAVEEPFSEIADFDVIPDCPTLKPHQGPWQVHRLRMRGTNYDAFVYGRRLGMTSKTKIPVQGILLGRTAVIWEAPVLPVDPDDLPDVLGRFPEGNARTQSWLNGKPIGPKGRSALIGGRVYHFGSDEELTAVSRAIAAGEQRLGPHIVKTAWEAASQGGAFDVKRFEGAAKVAASQWTETPKRVLVLRLDFTPVVGTPYTYNQFVQTMAQASDAIQMMSYGKTWIIPTISTQVLVLPNTGAFYGDGPSGALADAADLLATASGYALADYDVRAYSAAGPGGAWALVGGDRMWMRGLMGLSAVETHELGHNYGVVHANFWRPQTGIGLWSRGNGLEHQEYGDLFDIMGGNIYRPEWADLHLNGNLKAALNWIEPTEVVSASSNGIYRLHRFDHPSARANPGTKLALSVRNRADDEFWVSFRGAAWPASLSSNSALIVWTPHGPNTHELLDTTPLSVPDHQFDLDRNDCALPPGAAWTDPTGAFRIRNLGHGGISPYDYLDLEVTHFSTSPLFEFYTTADRNVRGLVASFVNHSLQSYAPQDDWRVSQTISGTRVDPSLSFPSNSWGLRASVGLTHGTDADWDDYSVQWDGYLLVNRTAALKTSSGDGSRMWIDLNNNSAFGSGSPEFTDNSWGQGQGGRISPSSGTIAPGFYRIRIQYEAGVGAVFYNNYFAMLSTAVEFEFFTTSALTTNGLTASYVNQSLHDYAPQDDWRITQVIAGSRVEDYPGYLVTGWGSRASLGLTNGNDSNWDNFSTQWDGWLRVRVPTIMATFSDDGSRMWIDVDGNGVFGASAPEHVNGHWSTFQDATFGENSRTISPGTYKFRIQYEAGYGDNAFVAFGKATAQSEWFVFNDTAPGNGTHPDTTTYDILGDASLTSGPLKDVRSGDELPVTLHITRSITGVSPNATQGTPAVGTPLDVLFRGYVDFAGNPNPGAALTNAAGWVTYTFTGLNPAQRYSFKAGAVGGNTNGWTLCELAGVESFLAAHSSTRVLTTAEVPALNATQAALNTGANHTPQSGDYVGWDGIQPGDDGSFSVTCRLYTGAVPGGSAASTAWALTGIRLEEFAGPPALVEIVAEPISSEILEGQAFELSVSAAGTPLFYQWYKDGVLIPRANTRWLRVGGATPNDTGVYFVVVYNQSNSVTSAGVSVGVYPDAATAQFRVVPRAGGVTNGTFPLRVTGVAAKGPVMLEVSTNLVNWLPLRTNSTSGPSFDFTDSLAGGRKFGFYRASAVALPPPPSNQPPSVAITYPSSGSSFTVGGVITVDATATDADGPVARVEFFVDGGSRLVDSTEPYQLLWQPAVGSYELVAVATDIRGGTTMSAPIAVTITPPSLPLGTYFESNGLVVIEAEHFAQSSANSGHSWIASTNPAGFVGDMAMQATPNSGDTITANIPTTSPVMTYFIQFVTPGTYNLWLRVWAASSSDDSVHLGLNGQVLHTLNYSSTGAWVWRSKQIVIPTAARHEINVWMREDGAYVDRLLLSTNLSFTPTGNGPPESGRVQNYPPAISEWFPPGEDWPPGEPITVAVGQVQYMRAEVEVAGGGRYTCAWTSDLGPIETQTKLFPGFGWLNFVTQINYTPTLADVGVRTITVTVQDSDGLSVTHIFTLTVTAN